MFLPMLELLTNPLQFEQFPEEVSCLLVLAYQLNARRQNSTHFLFLVSCELEFSLCDIRATEWSILISDQLSLSCETAARPLNECISRGSPWDRYQVTKWDKVQTFRTDLLRHLPWKFRYSLTFWDLWVEYHGEVQIAVRFCVSVPVLILLAKMMLSPTRYICMIARGTTVGYHWKSYTSISVTSIKFDGE
jgi:hypothetical protein